MRHYTTRLENVGEKKGSGLFEKNVYLTVQSKDRENASNLSLFNRTKGQTSERLPLVRHKTGVPTILQ